jgi:hypothetical protein
MYVASPTGLSPRQRIKFRTTFGDASAQPMSAAPCWRNFAMRMRGYRRTKTCLRLTFLMQTTRQSAPADAVLNKNSLGQSAMPEQQRRCLYNESFLSRIGDRDALLTTLVIMAVWLVWSTTTTSL